MSRENVPCILARALRLRLARGPTVTAEKRLSRTLKDRTSLCSIPVHLRTVYAQRSRVAPFKTILFPRARILLKSNTFSSYAVLSILRVSSARLLAPHRLSSLLYSGFLVSFKLWSGFFLSMLFPARLLCSVCGALNLATSRFCLLLLKPCSCRANISILQAQICYPVSLYEFPGPCFPPILRDAYNFVDSCP